MIRRRLPPTFIVATPSSQPGITPPVPMKKLNGCVPSSELSNLVPRPEPARVVDDHPVAGQRRCPRTLQDIDVLEAC
jgi:hypothetical protein